MVSDELKKDLYKLGLLGIKFYGMGNTMPKEGEKITIKFSIPKEVQIDNEEMASKLGFKSIENEELINHVKSLYSKIIDLDLCKFMCAVRDDVWDTDSLLNYIDSVPKEETDKLFGDLYG